MKQAIHLALDIHNLNHTLTIQAAYHVGEMIVAVSVLSNNSQSQRDDQKLQAKLKVETKHLSILPVKHYVINITNRALPSTNEYTVVKSIEDIHIIKGQAALPILSSMISRKTGSIFAKSDDISVWTWQQELDSSPSAHPQGVTKSLN